MPRSRLVVTLGVWICATGMALLFARITKVGPSLALSANHGVHLGDLIAFALAYGWAAAVTLRVRRGEG